jgi:hypothetical protein
VSVPVLPNTNTIAIPGKRSKEKMHQYFAYGSNMDKEDLNTWCDEKKFPKITPKSIIPAKLVGYRLAFNYFSLWFSLPFYEVFL